MYPNPAYGDTTNIRFQLDKVASNITIKLYTTSFRRIAEKTYSQLGPGILDIPLELKDSAGTHLANGFYYVAVEIDGKKTMLKMIVLR